MNKQYGSCKYCHKTLEKVKCPYSSIGFLWLDLISEVWDISVHIWFLLLSYFSKKINRKEYKSKKIITCNNKDCIGYLDGCLHGKKF